MAGMSDVKEVKRNERGQPLSVRIKKKNHAILINGWTLAQLSSDNEV